MADRAPAGRGRISSGAALFTVCDLHAAAAQRVDDDDEQPLQRLAYGRRVARQVVGSKAMNLAVRGSLIACALSLCVAAPAAAQKSGGVLRMPIGNSPASMSIHVEATRIAVTPMMAVFNNLVLFDQHIAQNTFE